MGRGNCRFSGSLVLLLILPVLVEVQREEVSAQNCLLAAQGRATPFRDKNWSSHLDSHALAIITSYKFECCGNITTWQTYVVRGGLLRQKSVFDIAFQVWRPSPTVQETGCYSMVGENIFTSISLGGGGLVSATPEPSNILTVQPGDVVGYSMVSRRGVRNGIQLDTSQSIDSVWYHTNTKSEPLINRGPDCPYPVGSEADRSLMSSTNAAPVLLVSVTTSTCLPSMAQPSSTPTPTPPNSKPIPSHTSTSTPISQINNQFSQSSDITGAVVGTLTAIVVPVVIISIVAIGLVMLRRTKQIRNGILSNPIYDYYCSASNGNVQSSTTVSDNHYRHPQFPLTATKNNDDNGIYQDIGVKTECTVEKEQPAVSPRSTKTTMTKQDDYAYCNPEFVAACKKSSSCTMIGEDCNSVDKSRGFRLLESEYYSSADEHTMCLEMEFPKKNIYLERARLFQASGLVVPNQKQRTSEISDETKYYDKLKFVMNGHVYWTPASTAEEIYDQLASRKYQEITRKQISTLEYLGSGQFGTVSKALWTASNCSLLIAIKTLRSDSSCDERVKLLREAAIMGQFNHTNVVKLYGLVTIGSPLILCLEYMKNGDLRSYLSHFDLIRDDVPNGHKDIKCFFVQVAKDIAAGMQYLSSKDFIHRDLAARNILLDEFYTCKIGDFGMSRDLMDEMYYTAKGGGKIPIKWTAPEALLYKKYSSDSDVWSYGMVLFEIWTLGKRPFSCTSNCEVLTLIQTGFCQVPPPGCPRAIYKLMVDCWNPIHTCRPKFAEVYNYLQQPVSKLLHWSLSNNQLSPSVNKLGATLAEGEKLHADLQYTYIKSKSDQQK